MASLLATHQLAQAMGAGGLNPRLAAALEAELRFPARSAGPKGQGAPTGPLPENVIAFPPTDPAFAAPFAPQHAKSKEIQA